MVADGEALRQALGIKGAGGVKPCHLCVNVLQREHALLAQLPDDLTDIASSDPQAWQPILDQELFDYCDQLPQLQRELSARAFAEEQLLAGIVYDAENFLQDQASRALLPPSRWMYDPMHTYYTPGGIAAVEVVQLLTRVETETGIAATHLAEALRDTNWQCPGHVTGLNTPSSRAKLLHSLRLTGKTYKGKATDVSKLLPLLACLLELLLDDGSLEAELRSLGALLQVRTEFSRLKMLKTVTCTQDLKRLQLQHREICPLKSGNKRIKLYKLSLYHSRRYLALQAFSSRSKWWYRFDPYPRTLKSV